MRRIPPNDPCNDPDALLRRRNSRAQGINDFRGQVLHSSEFKDVGISQGKHVVLLGSGRSPADLVVTYACVHNSASASLLNGKVSTAPDTRCTCRRPRLI